MPFCVWLLKKGSFKVQASDIRKKDTALADAAQDVSDEAVAAAMQGILTEEQHKLLGTFDKESDVRTPAQPVAAKLFYNACIFVSLYHFITSFAGTPVVLEHRSLHVGMILALGFAMYSFTKKDRRDKVTVCDGLLILLSLAVPFYIWIDYLGVVERVGIPDIPDTIAASVLVLLVLEATRRMSGPHLPVLSLIFLAY